MSSCRVGTLVGFGVVVRLGGVVFGDVAVTVGFFDGFFVAAVTGFRVAAVAIGRFELELVDTGAVVVRSLMTDWNVVNSKASADVVVVVATGLLDAAEVVVNGTWLVDDGLLDGRFEVVDGLEPVDGLSFCGAGSFVESVAKTVVLELPGEVVGRRFLLERTPEETVKLVLPLLVEVAGEVVGF